MDPLRISTALLCAVLLAAASAAPSPPAAEEAPEGEVRTELSKRDLLVQRANAGPAVRRSQAPPPALAGRLSIEGWRGTGDPVPFAVGDLLTASHDDGFPAPVEETWEAALRASAGPAGPDDWVSVRFPMQTLAVGPPFEVDEVLLGLDNLHGRAVWPEIELRLEDAASPLEPRAGAAMVSVSDFDAAATLPAPSGNATRPDVFERLPVGVSPLEVADGLWLSDGGFDDTFDRTSRPLDTAGSSWLECDGASCGVSQDLFLFEAGSSECAGFATGCVRNTGAGGDKLAIRIQDADLFARRPALDNDQSLSVRLDLSDPAAERAGIAVRISPAGSFFTYYRVEYVKASAEVEVAAVDETGAASLLDTFSVAAPTDTPELAVEVTGHRPEVSLRVLVDGQEVGTHLDASFLYAGVNAGLASSSSAGGEIWDDFRLERRPDLFVNVRFPQGGFQAMPLDVSEDALVSGSVLLSNDGSEFRPRAAPTAACLNPGNPFVQLRVRDHVEGDRLFVNEAHLVRLAFDCPACPAGRNRCVENLSVDERFQPVAVVGATHTLTAAWWNQHLSPDDVLTLEGIVLEGACDDPGATILTQGSVEVNPDPGQVGGLAELRSSAVVDFVPTAVGPHCLVLFERHAGGDWNPLPAFLLRDIRVYDSGCVPKAASNLDPTSLRVAKDAGDRVATILRWGRIDVGEFPADVNLHVLEAEPFDPAVGFHVFAPILGTILGPNPPIEAVRDLPPPASGRPLWFAVFETDGCPTGNSIAP